MAKEYISREAAITEIYRFGGYLDDDMEWRLQYALKKLPAADVAEEKLNISRRAVHIAAVVMQAEGLCRYDTYEKCRRFNPTDSDCVDCIEKWLLAKARQAIKKETKP